MRSLHRGLEVVGRLHAVEFCWADDPQGRRTSGFLAQQVGAVLPEVRGSVGSCGAGRRGGNGPIRALHWSGLGCLKGAEDVQYVCNRGGKEGYRNRLRLPMCSPVCTLCWQ